MCLFWCFTLKTCFCFLKITVFSQAKFLLSKHFLVFASAFFCIRWSALFKMDASAHRCHFPNNSAWRLAYWSSCLHFLLLLQPCFWSSCFLSKVLVPKTDLAPPQPRTLPSGWLKCFNWGSDDTGQRLASALPSPHCLLPPKFHCQGHHSRTAENVFPHLWGWRGKLVNTSLWQRGAIVAGTNCDYFKGSAGHYELEPSLSPSKWVS